MANSPVQIILNTNDFIEALENKGGGPSKDFFAGNDEEFVEHREFLQQQLNDIQQMQLLNSFTPVSYGKVILKQTALAKSHRPTKQLFKSDTAPIVGAGDLGELYVEFTPSSVQELVRKVGEAESATRYKEKNGEVKPSPSRLRSEVGAIDSIVPYGAEDKINFSVNEAIEWFRNPKSGGCYLVELFVGIPRKRLWDLLDEEKLTLFQSFIEGLEKLGNGIYATKVTSGPGTAVIFGIKLEKGDNPPIIQLSTSANVQGKSSERKETDLNVRRHSALLQFLGQHPLVKKVGLPPIINQSTKAAKVASRGDSFKLPAVDPKRNYPKICVVDGGVSDMYGDWIEDKWDFISSADKEESHGTFIAGLTIVGRALNGTAICKETDGCRIIDLDILPRPDKYDNYFRKPMEFFNELEGAVQELTARTGVRIFNFSLNIEAHASTSGYSIPAQILDKIAEENDIIFVISAGNIKPIDNRKEWPSDHFEALKILATSKNDIIKHPAESCRNISVSAVNPPNMSGVVPYALTTYSCRGPGLRVGLKPDFAHVGGCGTPHSFLGHGLLSLDPDSDVVDGCGTSYAAPLVAKTLASLDLAIEGAVSRETLIALSVHHADLPESLSDKKLRNVMKDLVGFGIPKSTEDILDGPSSAITLVFANRAIEGHKLSFKFSWPPSLVRDGKCVGHAKLTIVSTPRFDYRYGAEFVRVNIDAALRQLQNDGSYKGRLEAAYTPDHGNTTLFEKDQIEHAFKWSPVKVYEKTFKKGVGPTTDWSLDVEYLARDGAKLPKEGVPFTAILSISDPTNIEPVFNDMRKILTSAGVQAVDIRTAARVTPRV